MAGTLDRLGSTLVYSAQATVGEIRADIQKIIAMDKEAEGKQRTATIAMVISGLSIIGGGIAMAVTNNPGMLVISGLGLAGLIGGGIRRTIVGKLNFQDRRYQLLDKTLELLGKDMSRESVIGLRLDLSAPDVKKKFVNKGKIRQWNTSFFEDPWMDLKGRFVDGTSFNLIAIERTQHRSCWKRSRSGKSKHKSKIKRSHGLVLRMKAKQSKYEHTDQIALEAGEAIKLPSFVETKSLAIEGGMLALKTASKTDWSIAGAPAKRGSSVDGLNWVAMMFLSLYQILNLSRAMSKAAN